MKKLSYLLLGWLTFASLLSACSGTAAKIDTEFGQLELGEPFGYKYDYKNECHLPFRWADGSEMTTEDLNFVFSKIQIYTQRGPCNLSDLGFGNDSYDWDLVFTCDCREKEVWLYVDGKEITSLGDGKNIGK